MKNIIASAALFLNQGRLEDKNGVPVFGEEGQWHDVCHGHDTLDEAEECNENSVSFVVNGRDPTDLPFEMQILLGQAEAETRRNKAAGRFHKFRVVRRELVVAEEVVESVVKAA